MPKFVLSVSTNGRPRQITVHAPDEQAARREAEMDGHFVRDVALAMPDPVAPPRDPKADPKDKGFQLACAALGIPGLWCLFWTATGNPYWFPGAALLMVVYFGLCVPRKAVSVWRTFNGLGLGILAISAAAIILSYHGPIIYGDKLNYKPEELAVRVAGHVLGCLGLLVLSLVRIKP